MTILNDEVREKFLKICGHNKVSALCDIFDTSRSSIENWCRRFQVAAIDYIPETFLWSLEFVCAIRKKFPELSIKKTAELIVESKNQKITIEELEKRLDKFGKKEKQQPVYWTPKQEPIFKILK